MKVATANKLRKTHVERTRIATWRVFRSARGVRLLGRSGEASGERTIEL
jgi:hypothetical protein